ncbi:MAG: hypothetical protein ACREOE_12495, partial [Gemmatimonadales bacterium]
MHIHDPRRLFPAFPVLLVAAAGALLLLACGGTAVERGSNGDGGGITGSDSATCDVLPCPSNASWDPTLCECVTSPGSGCGDVMCPRGQSVQYLHGSCVCQLVDNGSDASDGDLLDADVSDSTDGQPADVTSFDEGPAVDSPYDYDVQPSYDGMPYYADGYPVDQEVYCGYSSYCGPGYTWEASNGYCQCVACQMVCPNGETPDNSCTSCVACTTACPAGFYVGQNCNCIPDGVDAGPPPIIEAGPMTGEGGSTPGCTLEGYRTCPLGSWCELGVCPDNKTQYGCYCDTAGNTTCNLACPQPQACTIPGLGTCAAGQACIFGASACQGDSGSVLECSCYSNGGNASCYSLSCAQYESYYGPDSGFDSGPSDTDGGPSCYLQGYT